MPTKVCFCSGKRDIGVILEQYDPRVIDAGRQQILGPHCPFLRSPSSVAMVVAVGRVEAMDKNEAIFRLVHLSYLRDEVDRSYTRACG